MFSGFLDFHFILKSGNKKWNTFLLITHFKFKMWLLQLLFLYVRTNETLPSLFNQTAIIIFW